LREKNKRLNCRIREKFQELRGPKQNKISSRHPGGTRLLLWNEREMGAAIIGDFSRKEVNMNAEILKGQWKEIKGDIKAKWGKLTDDDLTEIEGKEEKLLGVLQKRHGLAKDKAEQEYKEFMKRYEKPSGSAKK
jgi:uncharacterized protein YjbJ (UPF0337 family)